MTAVTQPGRLVPGPVTLWYRDTVSCLQSTLATVVLNAGHDPLEVLGAHWEFLHLPGDVRLEEYYHPCRHPGDLGRSLAPHHRLTATWETGGDDPIGALSAAVAAGEMRIAAVDNYHLPFRPAYHDVHAAHLVVVYGVDRKRGLVYVTDAQPPHFHGPIAIEAFERAWAGDGEDGEEHFFSATASSRRILTTRLDEPVPAMTAEFLATVLGANLALLTEPDDGDDGHRSGLAGLRRFTEELRMRISDGDPHVTSETYAFGWSPQAQSSLHGELLRTWGAAHGVAAVAEAGRLVDHVAHCWTAVRVTCAHREVGPTARGDLRRHTHRLTAAYEAAVEGLEHAREAL